METSVGLHCHHVVSYTDRRPRSAPSDRRSPPRLDRRSPARFDRRFPPNKTGPLLTRRTPSSRPPPPPPQEKRRHWKEGEFPAVSYPDTSSSSHRFPIKNIKKKLDDRNAARAWAPTVTEALSDRIHKKQWEGALQVFEMLQQQPFYQPKEATYLKLILLLGKSSQPHLAHRLFQTMVENELDPTPQLYTALLAAYSRNNLVDDALNVLEQMKGLPHCQPDVYTYSTLLKGCVEAGRFDVVDMLYQDMSDRLVYPNTVTQNIVLSGYGKAGKYDEMERVLSGMLENEACKPDVWTMNTILGLFGNKGQIDYMEKWYEKFRIIGIEPETRTFNILIGAYAKKKLYDKMTAVLEYMRKLQFPWTTSTYNNVIEAFADMGDATNMDLAYNQMREEGMKADTKTFCCLINGYSNARLFHKVVSSVQMAEKLEVPANTCFYNAVILACARAQDLIEMERVFTRMKEKHIVPDSQTFIIMIDAYAKEGMSDKIYVLEQERDLSLQILG